MTALTHDEQLAFIGTLITPAQTAQTRWGVPASVTIAQAILESGWGRTSLARLALNYFGVKAHGNLDYMEFPTHEWVAGQSVATVADFAKYPDVEASFADHATLIATLPRYAPAMAVRDDPTRFAAALQTCGYSTNPAYGAELWQIIQEYGLAAYDAPPAPPPPAQPAA